MTTCIVIYQTEDTDQPVIARNQIRTFAVLQYSPSIHCASEQSDQTIPRPSIYPKVPTCIGYITGQRRPRSACADAQADRGFRCPRLS